VDINSIDIAAAFLQGHEITREIYMKPPKDVRPEGKIWKLKCCIYGLNDAPREWYKLINRRTDMSWGSTQFTGSCYVHVVR
jgi:flavodoxin